MRARSEDKKMALKVDWVISGLKVVRRNRSRLLAAGVVRAAWTASLAVLSLSSVSAGQNPKPPKKTAIIFVHLTQAPEEAYRSLARVLTSRGYGLQSSDAVLHSITTTFRETKEAGPVQLSGMVITDSLGAFVQLTGVWKWPVAEHLSKGMGDTPEAIEYGGMGGSPKRKAWDEMHAVAAALPNGRIEYRVP